MNMLPTKKALTSSSTGLGALHFCPQKTYILCPIFLKNAIKGTVIHGAAQSWRPVPILNHPPGTRTFQADMADKLVGRFDAAATDGYPGLPASIVVQSLFLIFQVSD